MWVCEHVIPASSLGSSGQAKEAPLAESQTSELPRDDLALETLRSSEELWKVKVKVKSCPTLCEPMDCNLSGSSVHGIFSGKSTGVGCHFHLQGIFLNQGSNPGPSEDPHCRLPSEPPWKNLLQKHNLKASILWQLSLLYGPALTSIHDHWKSHRFD